MRLFRGFRPGYLLFRRIATFLGIMGFLRSWLGPLGGRAVSRVVRSVEGPTAIHGHSMVLSTDKEYAPVAMATDHYEEGTTRLFESLLKPGMMVVDVGAHVGYYALLAARQVGPQGRVTAFEPEAANYDLLIGNIQRNGYTNVAALQQAVSNSVGTTTLFLTALDNGRHSVHRHRLPERGTVSVETTTLDAFFGPEDWPEVNLIKVDVEGAEQDVVDGMAGLLGKNRDLSLIVEFSPTLLRDAGADHLRFLRGLWGMNFKVEPIDDQIGPSTVPDDDWPAFITKLLRSEGSVNLFCSRTA